MKTLLMTQDCSASHRTMSASQWLGAQNRFCTQLVGCSISNLSFIGAIAFQVLALATLLLASVACQAYGWAAFTAVLAINAVLPIIHEIHEGGTDK